MEAATAVTEPVIPDNANSVPASAADPAPDNGANERKEDPMEADTAPSMSLVTQGLIEELGNDMDTILREERHVFDNYLEAAIALTPALQSFHKECQPCAAPFEIPATPQGCDDLDQAFRNACAVIDNTERAQAIDASLARNTRTLQEVKDARDLLAARKKILSTPLNTAARYGDEVSYVTFEFSNIMIQYNQWMKKAIVAVEVTLELNARADLIRTRIDEELLAPREEIRTITANIMRQLDTPKTEWRFMESLYHLLLFWVQHWETNGAKYRERQSKSAWVPPTYSMYSRSWEMATPGTIAGPRKPGLGARRGQATLQRSP
jgi:hypothetical protein